MNLISIVHELRLAKGSKKKIKILELHESNELWKKFLNYTYNPLVSYGVSAPLDCTFDMCDVLEGMFDDFDKLSRREVTGNAAKALTLSLSRVYGEIPRLILMRTIKAGISFTTINKVYIGLIPVFETMKGKDVPIEEYPVCTSIKYDGVKVFAEAREDGVQLFTSSGMPFEFKQLEDEFKSATMGVYEGELTHKEGKMIHRPVITGVLNSLLAGSKKEFPHVKFRIYDIISLYEWDAKESHTPWETRQEVLISQFETGFQESAYVEYVEQHRHENWEEVEEMFNELVSTGYEGTMSRYGQDSYSFKRVDRLIKKKSIHECVLRCRDYVPHSNPSKGIVGSLVLEGEITDKFAGKVFVTVNTGSGLSKFDINCEPERYLGEDIEIMYNSVTSTDSGHSLFLPRYKRIVNA